jgi:hypothetical protein
MFDVASLNASDRLEAFDSYQLRLMRGIYAETGIKPPGFSARGKGSLKVGAFDGFRLGQFGYGPRGIDGSAGIAGSQLAFGDVMMSEYVYNDTSSSLTVGMPLYVDVTDAAEWNVLYSTTALSPAGKRTGGNVVLGTNANAGSNLTCVGFFYPNDNLGGAPKKGDTVRVVWLGRCLASAIAAAAGTAVLVGDVLLATATYTSALSGHNTPVTNKTLGLALATGTAVANTNAIIAVPGSSTTVAVINAFARMT